MYYFCTKTFEHKIVGSGTVTTATATFLKLKEADGMLLIVVAAFLGS
jgi:hypothetical protein